MLEDLFVAVCKFNNDNNSRRFNKLMVKNNLQQLLKCVVKNKCVIIIAKVSIVLAAPVGASQILSRSRKLKELMMKCLNRKTPVGIVLGCKQN